MRIELPILIIPLKNKSKETILSKNKRKYKDLCSKKNKIQSNHFLYLKKRKNMREISKKCAKISIISLIPT